MLHLFDQKYSENSNNAFSILIFRILSVCGW